MSAKPDTGRNATRRERLSVEKQAAPSCPAVLALLAIGIAATGAGCHFEGDVEDPPGAAPRMLNQRQVLIDPEVLGQWYLDRGGQRVALTLTDSDGLLAGHVAPEGPPSPVFPLEAVWYTDDEPGVLTLAFRTTEGVDVVWHRLQIADGVVTGRYTRTATFQVPAPQDFQAPVAGWRHETFDADIVPRTFDIAVDGLGKAVLRLDAGPGEGEAEGESKRVIGQLKIYADGRGVLSEQLSEEIAVQQWDGKTLRFVRTASPDQPLFVGTTTGRLIAGTARGDGDPVSAVWSGERTEVLSHGISPHDPAALQSWQARTRVRLARLVMGGNPAPLSTSVAVVSTRAPIPTEAVLADRDDAFAAWPQSYRLDEIRWQFTLPGPTGAQPLTREAHGFVALPTTDPPPRGYPVAVALNGHWGAALQDFNPQNGYWYGDAFARRGYVVVAVDVSHRPLEDRQALYADMLAGDDAGSGNAPHPAVRVPGLPSEWEEDGERAWDAMRALDYVLARPDVDPARVTVIGLSLGGEVADWVGALDLRFAATLAAGNPPDWAVMQLHGNHPCFNWMRTRIREYLDPSDLHALVAPRTLIRETGAGDATYSAASWPYAAAKQVVWRAQPAFDALGGTLLHYMHGGAHVFRMGDATIGAVSGSGVTAPAMAAPTGGDALSTAWESDSTTVLYSAMSLFDVLPR